MTGAPWVRVAAAVIFAPDGRVLLAQRPQGKAYAGYWEFPGGKLEPGESGEAALVRELDEELGIAVGRAVPWITLRYVYPHARVELQFFRVLAWSGEPEGRDGQEFRWQRPGAYEVAPLLPANTPVLRALELPVLIGITDATAMGHAAFVRAFERALDGGLRLAIVREPAMDAGALRALVRDLAPIARQHGARLILNGPLSLATELGLDGVHLTAKALAALAARPAGLLCGASCHVRAEIERAAELALDYALLSPVRATATHPKAAPIGWDGFQALAQPAGLPVFALGGLVRGDLDRAWSAGAHGVAMLRAAWAH